MKMKSGMKKVALTLAAIGVIATSFVGCGSKKTIELVPDTVDNFTLDFETGDFSFDFDGEAKSFYVRIFENGSTDDTMPLAARRVRYRSEQTNYSGTMNLSDLQPGDTFDAYVYTYVKDENGDLHYSKCDAISGVYKTAYKAPADGYQLNIMDGKLVLNFNNSFFSDANLDKAPSYKVTLYKGGAEAETVVVANSDLDIVETEEESSTGQISIKRTVKAKVEFKVTDLTADYTASVSLISTDDAAYYDSEEGVKVPVTEYVEEVEEDNNSSGGNGFGGGEETTTEASTEASSGENSTEASSGENSTEASSGENSTEASSGNASTEAGSGN